MWSSFSNPQFIDWLSTLAISIGVALAVAAFVSVASGRLLGLGIETKLWAFLVSFAFLCSLATAPITATDSWSAAILLYCVPLMLIFLYFLPTVAAIASGHPAFQSVFIINLFFGWTIIGWFVALSWTLRRPDSAKNPGYRLTPFGAVPNRTPAEGSTKHG
jgi:hypothetical protein